MNGKRALVATCMLATCVIGARSANAADAPQKPPTGIDKIDTVVVIYAENRSFDNLYGYFPGANGLRRVTPAMALQRDRDGSVLKELPPIWGGLTAKGVTPPVTQAQTEAPPQPALRDRRSQGLQCLARRDHPRPLASLLPEPDADRRRQERQIRRLRRFRRAGDGPLRHQRRQAAAVERRAALCPRRQFLHGRLRRLVPQPFLAGLRLRAGLSERRSKPRQGSDRRRRSRMASP